MSALEEIGCIVRGRERREGVRLAVQSPFDQRVVGHCRQASRAQAEEAVEAAAGAFAETAGLSSYARHRILSEVAARIGQEREGYARGIMLEARSCYAEARAFLHR